MIHAFMYKFAFFKRLCLLSFCRVQKSFSYLFKFTLLLINFSAINCFPPKKYFYSLIVLNIKTWEYSHSVMPCICIYNVNCWQFCLTNECLYAKEKFWFLELWNSCNQRNEDDWNFFLFFKLWNYKISWTNTYQTRKYLW